MAAEKYEFLLNSELNNDQLSIAVDLAVSLRADEIEKFLEIYDSIPESIDTELIDQIKEMARQLAALPKKQFDLYRTKARVLGSGDHFNPPLTASMNMKENITFDSTNHMNKSVNGDCKNEGKINIETFAETEENKVAGVKSPKKKLKKKKKNKVVFSEEKHGLPNVEISSKNAKDSSQDQNILMTNKLLDPDQSSSRIATMKRTLVADICALRCSNSQGMESNKTSNKIRNKKNQDTKDPDIHSEQESKAKTMDENYSYDINDSNNHQSAPPFGFPLSASKLIQSAVGLLDSSSEATSSSSEHIGKQSKDNEIYVQQKNDTCGDVRQSTSFEIHESIQTNCNEGKSKTASTSGDDITSMKCETHGETESVDGDISNLSALEDEGGWQSQTRRSNRKKKKELAGRNPRERIQAKKKDNKTSNFKKQSFKNNTINRNQSGTSKEIHKTYTPNNATKDNGNGLSSKNNEEKKRKQEDAGKETFSYRDALLKTKPKSSEELQYNSDSGVDVNSVGSCDSAIHSSKTLPVYEFDLKAAVNFLRKGCDEVQVRHKQGRVHYYSV